MVSRLALVCVLSSLAMAGCASKPPSGSDAARTAYVPVAGQQSLLGRDKAGNPDGNPAFAAFRNAPGRKSFGSLAGRTLTVSSISEIRLADKEVILTFDDGPIPGKTDQVLATLRQYGVKATFLMVGQMASNYPAIARRVVAQGHSIGGHTYNHANLANAGYTRALTDIANGNAAVSRVTGTPVGFFRFPYLADTGALRQAAADRGLVILDVDIDSKDYFKLSPETLAANTMARVRAKRRGIILMHDIHGRTAAMLPTLLAQLKAGGYKVVALQYRRSRMPQLLVSAKGVRP
ncbi:polysaccharide deacetylase family protein [Hoeflea sp. EC-HK425]|uniref:polysaccharide deacetylase family protein n=1 Tax=Hoeflea sp. EC-HK425 TaxID=2038388 RepID=UPI00125B7165|nr:polysaccharide deacetylase family protein [Hoeflea sp. EC-HK425]VVT19626.1 Polysaccharide deacetylase [Hoeflea sp. EC-HK425]|tara:strand:+ start:1934 stop:2809 length:876 start_codon:yes stop_codon:yes gene_type:complete